VVNKIFSTNPKYVVGIYLVSPNLPIEEILFLFLLCYSTLIIYKTVERLPWLRTKTP
jgi:lycopene cyclase domain-containing protein